MAGRDLVWRCRQGEPMEERLEFGSRRTICSCKVCRKNCEVMPGFLLPSDLTRMVPADTEPFTWAETNLLASPGALVMKANTYFRIPTLVPAIRTNGNCKNLTSEGLCSIHEVAPFGCAFFDCHGGPGQDQLAHIGLNAVYKSIFLDRHSLYRRLWTHLAERGLVQQAAEVLRAKMRKELE